MSSKIDDLFNSFNEQSKMVKGCLTDILNVVTEGKIPTSESLSALEEEVDDLSKRYDEVYEEAKNITPAEEMPAYGNSFNEISDALEKYQGKYLKEQVLEAEKTLRKFIGIKSAIQEYANALTPYQKEAAEVLNDINEDTIEELNPKTVAPSLFIKIMELEDIDSSEGIALRKEIKQYYKEDEIQYGLSGKKFYFDESGDEDVEVIVPEAGNDEVEASTRNENSVDIITPDSVSEENAQKESESVSEESEIDLGVFTASNKVKKGKPSASAFQNDINKLERSERSIRFILPLFTYLGVMAPNDAAFMGEITGYFDDFDSGLDAAESAFYMLDQKGYLTSFKVSDPGEEDLYFYCLSKYTYSCMHKSTIEQHWEDLWALPYGQVDVYADNEFDVKRWARFNAAKISLFKYFQAIGDMPTGSPMSILQSITWEEDHYYQVAVYFDDDYVLALVANAFVKISELDAEYIILALDTCEIPEKFNDACEMVFVISDDNLYYCDPKKDIMEQIESASQNDDEDDEGIYEQLNFDFSNNENNSGSEPTEDSDFDEALDGIEEIAPNDERNDVSVQGTADTDVSNIPTMGSIDDKIVNENPDVNVIDVERLRLSNLTAAELLDLGRTPSDDEFCSVIHSLLNKDPKDEEELAALIVQANLLAKGAGLEKNHPLSEQFSFQLQLASNVLRNDCHYKGEDLSNAFANDVQDTPALALAAYMYALLIPDSAYDYVLKARTEDLFKNFDSYFGELHQFKELFNILMYVQKVKPDGFTPAVISLLGDEDEKEKFTNNLKAQARAYLKVNTPKTRMKALPILYSNEFGEKSELSACMEIISEGDFDSLEIVEDVLSTFCDNENGVYIINQDKIEERLDRAWDEANPKNKFKLEFDARDQALRQYKVRLDIMLAWTEIVRNQTKNKKDIETLKRLKNELLGHLSVLKADNSWQKVKDSNILRWLIYYMSGYLQDNISQLPIYADILYTGVFSLSEDGTPILDESFADIKYYEIWRNALRHIVARRRTPEEITADIFGENEDAECDELKDNLRQLKMLGKLLQEDDDIYIVSDQQLEEARTSADVTTDHFRDRLELAYTYYQINESEKEDLSEIVSRYQEYFYEIGDFACWRRFLNALEEQIQHYADGRRRSLEAKLQEYLNVDKQAEILLEAKKMLEEDSNFAVAEEYLNRYENGERDLDKSISADKDYFSEFLSDDVFLPLYNECMSARGRSVKNFGWNYVKNNFPKGWSVRQKDDSQKLIASWPVRKDNSNANTVKTLFEGLGFPVTKAKRVNDSKEELWQLGVTPTERSQTDYLHPIATFGTQMKSPLNAIFLYGNHVPQELVDIVTDMNLGGISLVMIDRPINLSDRRLIGEIFHTQKSGHNPFLLIDQVLFLYLAMQQQTERLPALLKCTLPYITYQPFLRDSGYTADEMFCGRSSELRSIINLDGACVVYGGRQLGKTALLQRAENLCSKPEGKQFAVYSNILGIKTEEEVVAHLIHDINRKTDGNVILNSCSTFREMCDQLSADFYNKKIVSIHLFIDEVDDFLEAIAQSAYKPIQPLVDLRRDTKNNFKFVIAGLHNVCRAENATKKNGIFGQLGEPLCIKPLSPTDALQLLSRPLRYLGFQIDRYPHLETILTNTNYYPGILQFFGYILVETLSGQYAKYYSAANGNPPFTLLDEQLGAVMNSADLNKSIKDKFRLSLELDPRYFMIARCITMLYHLYEDDRASGSWKGFRAEEIIDMSQTYDIHCLADTSKKEYILLLDEMVDMGILGRSKDNDNTDRYRLRRSSFVDIIGENMDVLEKDIISNNV